MHILVCMSAGDLLHAVEVTAANHHHLNKLWPSFFRSTSIIALYIISERLYEEFQLSRLNFAINYLTFSGWTRYL